MSAALLGLDDPFSLLSAAGRHLLILVALVPLALAVFWWASRQFRRERGTSTLRPKGRVIEPGRGRLPNANWRAISERLDAEPPTRVAEAREGPIRIVGTIVDASGTIGDTCVWRNRVGARAESAIGADLVIMRDPSGLCGVENIDEARVVAPSEKMTYHHETQSLQIGDDVEVLGHFTPEPGNDAGSDPRAAVYGTLAARSGLEVRLVSRPTAPVPSPPPPLSEDSP